VCIILVVLFPISFRHWWPLTSWQAFQQRTMFWRILASFPDMFWIFSHLAAVTAAIYSSVCIWSYKSDTWLDQESRNTDVDFEMREIFLKKCYWSEITHTSPAHNSWNFVNCILLHFVCNVVGGKYFNCWRLSLLGSSSNFALSIHDDYSHLNYTESSCRVFWD
jgi:hypothetical protein